MPGPRPAAFFWSGSARFLLLARCAQRRRGGVAALVLRREIAGRARRDSDFFKCAARLVAWDGSAVPREQGIGRDLERAEQFTASRPAACCRRLQPR